MRRCSRRRGNGRMCASHLIAVFSRAPVCVLACLLMGLCGSWAICVLVATFLCLPDAFLFACLLVFFCLNLCFLGCPSVSVRGRFALSFQH